MKALPRESALVRALDPQGWSWGVSEYLLAAAVEQIDAGNRLFLMANVKKGTRIPEPVEIPRPGAEKQKEEVERMATKAEILAFFSKAP